MDGLRFGKAHDDFISFSCHLCCLDMVMQQDLICYYVLVNEKKVRYIPYGACKHIFIDQYNIDQYNID